MITLISITTFNIGLGCIIFNQVNSVHFPISQRKSCYWTQMEHLSLNTTVSFKHNGHLFRGSFINISSRLISFKIISAIGWTIKSNSHPQRHNPLIFCLNRNFVIRVIKILRIHHRGLNTWYKSYFNVHRCWNNGINKL